MEKQKETIKELYNSWLETEEKLRSLLRNVLSAKLMFTDRNNPLRCNIALEVRDACGLSSLELPTVTSMWQEPMEGWIYIEFEGIGPCDFETVDTDELFLLVNELI